MRTAVIVISLFAAPVVARLVLMWVALPFAKVFFGWAALFPPWLVVGTIAYFFRPVGPAVDGLYVGAYVWWLLCYLVNALVMSVAIGGSVLEWKLREQALKSSDPPSDQDR